MTSHITTQLANPGARIIAECVIHRDHLVLCEYNGEYVTWKLPPDPSPSGKYACYLGSYFDNETDARRNFIKRAGLMMGVA